MAKNKTQDNAQDENVDQMENSQEELKNDQSDLAQSVEENRQDSRDSTEGQSALSDQEAHDQRIEDAKREGLRNAENANAANDTTEA